MDASQSRVDWIDAAKGAMIFFVVFGHTWRGLASSGLMPAELFAEVDIRIYSFHMPVFFALSGWLFVGSLTRSTLLIFWKNRFQRLLWPMVLWTYIFLGVKALAGEFTNSPIGADEVFILPIPGVMHMWFLWALLLISMAFSLLKPFCRDGKLFDFALYPALLIVVALQFLYLKSEASGWFGNAIRHAPYFALGLFLAQKGFLQNITLSVKILLAVVFSVIILFWPNSEPSGLSILVTLVLSVCILGFFAGPSLLRASWATQCLLLLGAASMPIYLSHTIFSAGFREALFAFGVNGLWLHVTIGTLVGLIGPILLLRIARRAKIERYLGF